MEGNLDLRLARLAFVGGDSGPAVLPGKPGSSYLLDRIRRGEMPPGKPPLSKAEIAAIEQWIADGAKTARPEPADANGVEFTAEELSHWAFQPIVRPEVPRSDASFSAHTPIDAFLAARLAAKGVSSFRPEADRNTLIRRASFDVLGLPPTPDEIADFVGDPSSNAWERVVDRLLASPHYGERWARHWMDVAGYAESDVHSNKDQPRSWAWKYRDYLIWSFNADRPWNAMIEEQLAADEILPRPWDRISTDEMKRLAAVGFVRMAPDNTGSEDSVLERNRFAAETLKIVSSAFLGLTVGCAECHDHRYDPVSTVDYYRMRAVFDPAFNIRRWKRPGERVFRVTPPETIAEIERIEAKATEMEKRISEEEIAVARGIQERELKKVPEDDRESLRAAVNTPAKQQTPEQQALIRKHLTVQPIPHVIGLLVEYDRKAFEELKKKKEEVARLRATKPLDEFVGVPNEEPGGKVVSRVFFRGDVDQPRQEVDPAEPAVLARHRTSAELEFNGKNQPTSGRRLAFARRLTDGKHPLCARVLVNRVWSHFFGRGIVSTLGDFGRLGATPTHPELLDWLAADFMSHGWRMKRLQKQMMMSAAYRQQSTRTPELDRVDPENELLGRANIRRLDAESIRDALLAAGGDLNPRLYGPSIKVVESGDGKSVLGKPKLAKDGLFYGEVEPPGPESKRRSIYVQALRVSPFSFFEAFDAPVMTPNCEMRKPSASPVQSLVLLNDPIVLERAERLAQRLADEAAALQCDPAAVVERGIQRAYLLLFARAPTSNERALCREFLTEQSMRFRTSGDDDWRKKVAGKPELADQRAMASLCQTLICANEFLYVD